MEIIHLADKAMVMDISVMEVMVDMAIIMENMVPMDTMEQRKKVRQTNLAV